MKRQRGSRLKRNMKLTVTGNLKYHLDWSQKEKCMFGSLVILCLNVKLIRQKSRHVGYSPWLNLLGTKVQL